jgi:hypothetical protein
LASSCFGLTEPFFVKELFQASPERQLVACQAQFNIDALNATGVPAMRGRGITIVR